MASSQVYEYLVSLLYDPKTNIYIFFVFILLQLQAIVVYPKVLLGFALKVLLFLCRPRVVHLPVLSLVAFIVTLLDVLILLLAKLRQLGAYAAKSFISQS